MTKTPSDTWVNLEALGSHGCLVPLSSCLLCPFKTLKKYKAEEKLEIHKGL